MTTATMLHDGRRVQADECGTVAAALYGPDGRPELRDHVRRSDGNLFPNPWWGIDCQCCGGSGEHHWSPSGHGVDPDGGHYGCGPCAGKGEFKVEMP